MVVYFAAPCSRGRESTPRLDVEQSETDDGTVVFTWLVSFYPTGGCHYLRSGMVSRRYSLREPRGKVYSSPSIMVWEAMLACMSSA